jgi:membrane protein
MNRHATEPAGARGTVTPSDMADKPTGITKPTWTYVARKTLHEFLTDECTDLAATLTYYAVLAVFPAMIALVSLVGVVGQGPRTVDTLLGILTDVGASSAADTLRPTLEALSQTPSAGLALILGLVGALWSASQYVSAFGRAMNRVYGIGEGRPIWKLRPVMLLVTLVLVVLTAAALLALIVSGPVTRAVGNALGLGSAATLAWEIAKWPVLLVIVLAVIAILYRATPNVKQPRLRWLSIGALVAVGVWLLASAAFAFYIANFASYNKTYGALAGAIVFLLWLWLTNLALLFGAELNAELERGRELQAGLTAEETIQLPTRDTRKIDKAEEQHDEDLRRGRELRQHGGGTR